MGKDRKLRVGEWVRVRSKDEILGTLDRKGELDGMPFMPEMFEHCGKMFQVHKRAHKTCDTVFPIRGRRVDHAVHLETRCTGAAHGGCQAACLIFWKDAWLARVDTGQATPVARPRASPSSEPPPRATSNGCNEDDIRAATRKAGDSEHASVYVCQATRLPYFSRTLAWWDIRQYFEDWASGNVRLGRLLAGLTYSAYFHLSQAGIGLGRPMRWLYDRLHRSWNGPSFPRRAGTIPDGQPTPTIALNLQPGELVRVKSYERILQTLTTTNKNRGMFWDAEMVPYCDQTHRVRSRVTSIIDEKTGRMQEMKSPCIILESVTCQARYSDCRMFCPRGIYPYWREIWLERASTGSAPPGDARSASAGAVPSP